MAFAAICAVRNHTCNLVRAVLGSVRIRVCVGIWYGRIIYGPGVSQGFPRLALGFYRQRILLPGPGIQRLDGKPINGCFCVIDWFIPHVASLLYGISIGIRDTAYEFRKNICCFRYTAYISIPGYPGKGREYIVYHSSPLVSQSFALRRLCSHF